TISLNERADELVAVATDQGLPLGRAQGAIYGGWAKAKQSDVTGGILLLRLGAIAFRPGGAASGAPYSTALGAGARRLARAAVAPGGWAGAATFGGRRLPVADCRGGGCVAGARSRHKGELLQQQGHSKDAEELYRRALGIAEEQGAKLWELRAAVSIARVWAE